LGTRCCGSCKREHCTSDALYMEAFQATNNAIEHASSDELRDWYSAASALAWSKYEEEHAACMKASAELTAMYKHDYVFRRAVRETSNRRSVFARAITQGMEQFYKRVNAGGVSHGR